MSGVKYAPEPRLALLCACIYSIVVALLHSSLLTFLAALPPLVFLAYVTSNWGALIARMRAPFIFILFICILVPFTSPGIFNSQNDALAPGFDLALLISLKCLALFAVFSAIIAPMSTSALAGALYSLHCPWQLAAMFLLMDMNLHIIKKEWERLKTAALLRGFKPGTNMATYRTYGAMLALWLLRAVERAKRAHEGMLLRGFDGRFPMARPGQANKTDYVFSLLTLSLSAIFFILNLTADKTQ